MFLVYKSRIDVVVVAVKLNKRDLDDFQAVFLAYEDKIRLYSSRGVKVKPGIWKLRNLQKLMTVEEHDMGINFPFSYRFISLYLSVFLFLGNFF